MEITRIPGIDIAASRVGLGTWAIGGWMWGGTDESELIRTIQSAVDRGITFIDTAPAYGQGLAEELVGRAIQGRRDRIVLATKCGLQWDSNLNVTRNSAPERIREEVEDSLRRLRTDVIDLYQVHWPDPNVPIEQTAGTMQELLREGKIRAIGVSNFSTAQMDRFRTAAPLHTSQPPYNLFEREIETDVLPYCHERGVMGITYGTLCRGLLSGRMTAGTTFSGDDHRGLEDPKFREPLFGRLLAAVEALDALARERFGRRVIHLAVRWLLDQPGVNIALWGARRPEQLDAVAEVYDWSLDQAAREEIDRVAPGMSSPA